MKKKDYSDVMSLFTSDGRCPMLCLLTNSMDLESKKSFLAEILHKHPGLYISDKALADMKKKGMTELMKYKKLNQYST